MTMCLQVFAYVLLLFGDFLFFNNKTWCSFCWCPRITLFCFIYSTKSGILVSFLPFTFFLSVIVSLSVMSLDAQVLYWIGIQISTYQIAWIVQQFIAGWNLGADWDILGICIEGLRCTLYVLTLVLDKSQCNLWTLLGALFADELLCRYFRGNWVIL